MITISLPSAEGALENYRLHEPTTFDKHVGQRQSTSFPRVAYAAAHVVADPRKEVDPWLQTAVDWDATIEYRRYLWSLGLGVAEAMDTAQRGMGLDWPTSLELIQRSIDAAKDFSATHRIDTLLANGAGTDHLKTSPGVTLEDVTAAYELQCEAIERAGGTIVLMASRSLVRAAKTAEDYVRVYDRILTQVEQPVIIHWLGGMFDPELAGYWGSDDDWEAMKICLAIIHHNEKKIDGIKISLLDEEKEISMRNRLPVGVRMYTGDDFNFPDLIAGDEQRHSDALLGIFDPIAPAASAALEAMSRKDHKTYFELLNPTVPLSRYMFKAPTRFYKTGVVFLAYLNGHQKHFLMVGGQESARSTVHLANLFRLSDKAGLLRDPELAAKRMATLMEVHGIHS
jgi:hypothetical protein|tara:strand:- start:423 stop:1616 length:1194 start_codon:yes stop_codon:yes gene_type:complete